MKLLPDLWEWLLGYSNELALIIAIFLIVYLLPSYFKEKGKNLAARQDISLLTEEVERVKSRHNKDLEILKSRLGHRTTIGRIQWETEIEIYKTIWRDLIDLRNATLGLRPILDQFIPEESKDEERRRRYQSFVDAFNRFSDCVHKNRPFYDAAVYDALTQLTSLARKESAEFLHDNPNADFKGYWERAMANSDSIIQLIDSISEAIRGRINNVNIIVD